MTTSTTPESRYQYQLPLIAVWRSHPLLLQCCTSASGANHTVDKTVCERPPLCTHSTWEVR
jgi:hypothetical protein